MKTNTRTSLEYLSYVRQELEETEESADAHRCIDYAEKFLRKKLLFSATSACILKNKC